MHIPDRYSIRSAGPDDAGTIAEHRSAMFAEMGLVSKLDRAMMTSATESWIFGLLASGEYQGWLVERHGAVVAGGGLHVSQSGPLPGCLRVGLVAHIANVFTSPAHRRLGLGRALVEEMLRWSRQNGVMQVTLEASEAGRPLYESLGFVASKRMSLKLL